MGEQHTDSGPVQLTTEEVITYRIGYQPDPFAWTPWQYADNGRFDGRWDDLHARFRTLYVADQLLGCLLEVLAVFRPDPALAAELAAIDDNDHAEEHHPTAVAGTVPRSWLTHRRAGQALMTGAFADVRVPITIVTLRTRHGDLARRLGLPDLDAAAIKTAEPRRLTQTIASWLYDQTPPLGGVCFASRHGDTLTLYALFEQPNQHTSGPANLRHQQVISLTEATPELQEAMQIHQLRWGSSLSSSTKL
jgi:hypothetical protein